MCLFGELVAAAVGIDHLEDMSVKGVVEMLDGLYLVIGLLGLGEAGLGLFYFASFL